MKINEVIAEKPCRTVASPGACGVFSTPQFLKEAYVGFSLILSIYKFAYISIKDLHAGYAATRWRNLLSNLPKCGFRFVEISQVVIFNRL